MPRGLKIQIPEIVRSQTHAFKSSTLLNTSSGGELLAASAEADLGQDSLASEQLSAEADHETEHGEAAIPGFCEFNKTKASGRLSHVLFRVLESIEGHVLRAPVTVRPSVLCCPQAGHCHR
ncbi:MAG: hypothetical protein RLZZ54_215 [Cyanobacteriota bacterium]